MSHTKNIGNIKYEEYFVASENVSDARSKAQSNERLCIQ